jgi:RHS repeat-associated protein
VDGTRVQLTITGLQYNRARYFSGESGRWVSEDPIGFGACDYLLTRYIFSNPTNSTDPSGYQPIRQMPGVRPFLPGVGTGLPPNRVGPFPGNGNQGGGAVGFPGDVTGSATTGPVVPSPNPGGGGGGLGVPPSHGIGITPPDFGKGPIRINPGKEPPRGIIFPIGLPPIYIYVRPAIGPGIVESALLGVQSVGIEAIEGATGIQVPPLITPPPKFEVRSPLNNRCSTQHDILHLWLA